MRKHQFTAGLLSEGQVAFSGFIFDPSSGELRRGTQTIKLRHQPAQVLSLLLSRAGEVVGREEIRAALWDLETHVDFEQGINWCVRELRKALNDDAASPSFIETLARRGYRFIAPLDECWKPTNGENQRNWSAVRILCIAAVAICVFLLAPGIHVGMRSTPVLLILPLDDETGDQQGERLALARTDYLISSLGENPGALRVIDRPTAMKFKGSRECIREIGRRLNADYVLVGSILKTGSGPRVFAGIFRVSDNTQLWTTSNGLNVSDESAWVKVPESVARALSVR